MQNFCVWRTSRSCVLREMPDVKRICYKLGLWVCSLSPRERAQAGHFCPAYASRYPCSFMNHKQGSGGRALLASARSLSAESGNRSGAGAKATARRTCSSGEGNVQPPSSTDPASRTAAATSAPRPSFSGRAIEDRRHRRRQIPSSSTPEGVLAKHAVRDAFSFRAPCLSPLNS